jgi:DNA-binding GntR family transcriptional regulator
MAAAASRSSTVSVVDSIILAIRDQLATGVIVPGQRLVEAELTTALNVSRSSLREALRKLVAEGLLDQKHNRGISVRKLSKRELLELLEVHEALSSMGARLAAENERRATGLKQLRQLWKRMELAARVGHVSEFLSVYPLFHDKIRDLSQNNYLIEMQRHLILYPLRKQLTALIDVKTMQQWHRDHKDLLDAIEAGNAKLAARLMAQHVERFINRVRKVNERLFN